MRIVSIFIVSLFLALSSWAEPVKFDFETGDLQGWKIVSGSFKRIPSDNNPFRQNFNKQGRYFIGTCETEKPPAYDDGQTGEIHSPVFTIAFNYLSLLVGGGNHPTKTYVALCRASDSTELLKETGKNMEKMDRRIWNVSQYKREKVFIKVVDKSRGGWGHINVDDIRSLSEVEYENLKKKVLSSAQPAQIKMRFEKTYLNFPVKNKAAKRRMRLVIDGETVREFEIKLAPGKPDFWVFLDITPFKGKKATLRVDSPSKGLKSIIQSDIIEGAAGFYKEKYRSQFHFSSRRGWLNDPNGLVYYKGEYHLFYQHNPYGCSWGNMHWGHAVSRDLVHWEELPIVLYPRWYDWCFSGSAVVDWDNTAGFKTGTNDVIVAAYTSTGRGESIAFSNDRGRTFTEYDGNPVIRHKGRDPKIIWYKPGKHWVMAVYEAGKVKRKGYIAFYTSKDLKKWDFQSRIKGYYECPEIFELPVDGDKKNTKWVVHGGNGAYSIGSFDGKTFKQESGKHQFNFGNCFYGSQTFNDMCSNQRIQIAWGIAHAPNMPFNQMMTFPVELTLRTTFDGIRMFAEPVRQIEKIRVKRYLWRKEPIVPGDNILDGITGDLFEIRAEFKVLDVVEFGFNIRGTKISYNVKKREIECRGKKAPLDLDDGKIRLHILVDRLSIEIFANDGMVYMPISVIPSDKDMSLGVFSMGGNVFANSIEVYKLQSTWKTKKSRKNTVTPK